MTWVRTGCRPTRPQHGSASRNGRPAAEVLLRSARHLRADLPADARWHLQPGRGAGEAPRRRLPRTCPDVLGNRPGFLKMLRDSRARYLAGEKFLPLDLPPHSIPWIEGSLIRLLVSDGKNIKENDAIDLLHAVVPLRYAIVLVFDKAWASSRSGWACGTGRTSSIPRSAASRPRGMHPKRGHLAARAGVWLKPNTSMLL